MRLILLFLWEPTSVGEGFFMVIKEFLVSVCLKSGIENYSGKKMVAT